MESKIDRYLSEREPVTLSGLQEFSNDVVLDWTTDCNRIQAFSRIESPWNPSDHVRQVDARAANLLTYLHLAQRVGAGIGIDPRHLQNLYFSEDHIRDSVAMCLTIRELADLRYQRKTPGTHTTTNRHLIDPVFRQMVAQMLDDPQALMQQHKMPCDQLKILEEHLELLRTELAEETRFPEARYYLLDYLFPRIEELASQLQEDMTQLKGQADTRGHVAFRQIENTVAGVAELPRASLANRDVTKSSGAEIVSFADFQQKHGRK